MIRCPRNIAAAHTPQNPAPFSGRGPSFTRLSTWMPRSVELLLEGAPESFRHINHGRVSHTPVAQLRSRSMDDLEEDVLDLESSKRVQFMPNGA